MENVKTVVFSDIIQVQVTASLVIKQVKSR